MDCNKCQELFSDYIDRLIDESLLLHLEKHLEECPGCASEWESFAAAVAWVRKMQFMAPEGILQGIREKIGEDRSKESVITRLFNVLRFHDFSLPLPAAAATLAVALLTMLAVKHFSGGNLPLIQPQHSTNRGSIAQSEPSDRSGTERFAASYKVAPETMYRQPIPTAASFSDFDSLLPLQQLGMQFVTSGNPSTFTDEKGLVFSPNSREQKSQQQFFSLLHAHLPPDVKITVNNLPMDGRLRLSRTLLNNPAWSAQHYSSDTILLYMDPCKLKNLHNMLAGEDVLIVPPDAKDAAFGSPKNVLTVAVRMR